MAITLSIDVKRFPARKVSGLETNNSQWEPNLVNMVEEQAIHSSINLIWL